MNADLTCQRAFNRLARVGFDAHLGDRAAVDHHAAVRNQLFGGSPRCDARLGEDLLKSDHWRSRLAQNEISFQVSAAVADLLTSACVMRLLSSRWTLTPLARR